MSGKVHCPSTDDDDESLKWGCDYCTYENWPSAAKCTMCGAPKPNLILRSYPEDIFEICAYEGLQSPTVEQHHVLNTVPGKWACQACTYLNWPRATRCVQCRTLKSIAMRTNNRSSTPTPSNTAEDLSDKMQSLALASSSRKWSCLTCTYANFPKSLKCVICNEPKPSSLGCEEESTPSPVISRSVTPISTEPPGNHPQGATADPAADSTNEQPKRNKAGKRKHREVDWTWLNACEAVVEGLAEPVIAFLKSGGDPARQLTRQDANLLKQSGLFEPGLTLVHLCLKFKREAILALVLENMEERRGRKGLKRMPSIIAPGLAKEIRQHVEACLRYKRGPCPGQFFSECSLFALPEELLQLSPTIQGHLWEELLDHEAQRDLEEPEEHAPPAINWLPDIVMESGGHSRLYALWNRTAGDCLLDACMQAAWGICDREGTLRRSLHETMSESTALFYPRWQEYECIQASRVGYALSPRQLCQEWTSLVRAAAQPGAALYQTHVFILAHIFRRPIIVYGVKSIKSYRGEVLGFSRFEGVYLPMLWDQSFCWKTPLTLGYTRGHFSALVPRVPGQTALGAGSVVTLDDGCSGGSLRIRRPPPAGSGRSVTNYVPLVTCDGKPLTVHYLNHSEIGHEERIIRQWLDVCLLDNAGPLVAEQPISRPNLLVGQMLDEWLNYYRQLSEMYTAPFRTKAPSNQAEYLIENDESDSD